MKDLDFDSIDVLAHILRRCLAMGYECGYTKAQNSCIVAMAQCWDFMVFV